MFSFLMFLFFYLLEVLPKKMARGVLGGESLQFFVTVHAPSGG